MGETEPFSHAFSAASGRGHSLIAACGKAAGSIGISNSASFDQELVSRFFVFERKDWAKLREKVPNPLSDQELEDASGLLEPVEQSEVEQVYLPLSRLLSIQVRNALRLYRKTQKFLHEIPAKVPFIVGMGGSVAVGKSTTARLLQKILASWEGHPRVTLISTDGFLYPNSVLEEKALMRRKGFPESFNVRALLTFLARIKAGEPRVSAPVYSHLAYDILPGKKTWVEQPDILIVEGLQVLQTRSDADAAHYTFVSDFFDFSLYIDAEEDSIRDWFIARFFALRESRFTDPRSYFHRFAHLSEEESLAFAENIWEEINGRNLRENILPTRNRAHVILHKGEGHRVDWVGMRKL